MPLSITSVTPFFQNPADQNADGSTFQQNFQVQFDVSNATPLDQQLIEARAINAKGIPRYGDQFRGNKAAYCRQISARIKSDQSENLPSLVIVTCTFTTLSVEKKDEETNPLDKSPDVNWSTHFENVAIINAREIKVVQNGQVVFAQQGAGVALDQVNNFTIPITNSAGQPFNPLPEVVVPYTKCTVIQNLPTFDIVQANDFIQSINSQPFRIDGYTVSKGTALLMNREATIEYQGQISYRQVTTEILFKDTHDLQLQDRGTKYFQEESNIFNGGDPTKLQVIETDGVESTEEQLFDGRGNLLEQGANPVYLNYVIHKERPFSQLGLPEVRL